MNINTWQNDERVRLQNKVNKLFKKSKFPFVALGTRKWIRIKRVYFSSSLVFVQVKSFFPLRSVYIVGDGYSYLLRAAKAHCRRWS